MSFASVPTKVARLKQDADGTLHAAVGQNLYKYKNRSWVIVYSNDEVIEDVNFDQLGFHLVSTNGVKRINKEKGKKTLYLSLRDVAGNASREPGTDASTGENIITDIDINDLVGFVHSNKLLELDEYGNVIWTYGDGENDSFYSGDRVIVEQAEYFSEVFNGGGDHVTWDVIYWDAIVPADTDLKVSVRTADSRDELLVSEWSKTFNKEDFQGGDISNLGGQFLQFRITMSTTVRGKSPKLYKVNIRSRTRTSVHFFTTNFVLPSAVKSGILTATTFIPLAADIIFGINTNDSTDFADYTIIEKDRLFKLDGPQGDNLRIGVKLISPLGINVITDELDEYSPYYNDVWNNVIPITYTNTSDESQTLQFRVELYEDPEFTESSVCTVYSGTTPTAFAVNGEVQSNGEGYELESGESATVLVAMKGNAAIRCNQFYYAKVYVNNGSDIILDDSHAFISNCYVNYVNKVTFDFTNESMSSDTFGFRAIYYSDPTRTQHVKTYSSNIDATGWTVDGSLLSESGVTLASGENTQVEFQPETGDLDVGDYYLVISYFDGTNFVEITKSPTIKVNDELSEYCGEYSNVPIFKDLSIMLEIEEYEEQLGSKKKTRRTVTFNLQ